MDTRYSIKLKMETNDNIILSFCKNCRICLQTHQQMVPIQLLKELDDFNTILAFFNVEVMTDLRYPNGICMVCLNQLRNFIIFKQKCESSFNYLKNILNDSEFQILPVKFHHIFDNDKSGDETGDPGYNFDQDTNIDENHEQKIADEICHVTINNSDIKTEEPDTPETTSFLCNKCNFPSETCNCINNHIKSEIDVDESKENSNLFSVDKSKNHFKCKYCEKTFRKSYHQQRHERTHERRFKCDYCMKSFLYENVLTRHIRIHLGLKPYLCTECSKSFSTHSGLSDHKMIKHSANLPPKVTCQKCGKAVLNLRIHIRLKHSTQSTQSFQCQYCEKKFAYKRSLQYHVAGFHENSDETSKVLCTLCGKKFRRIADLNKHNKAVHSDERNYPCRYCDKRFKTNSARGTHERCHLNDRRFKCTYCLKAFMNGWALENHVRIHTGEKPFSCSICSKAFRQSSTLYNHTRLVHGQLPENLQKNNV